VIKYQVVCFCDIPVIDLAIHVRKYSKFGLAFKKAFLIERGACPVFYVANESPVSTKQVFSPDDFSARINAAGATRASAVSRPKPLEEPVTRMIFLFMTILPLVYLRQRRRDEGLKAGRSDDATVGT
jgi:hypothetical protein